MKVWLLIDLDFDPDTGHAPLEEIFVYKTKELALAAKKLYSELILEEHTILEAPEGNSWNKGES